MVVFSYGWGSGAGVWCRHPVALWYDGGCYWGALLSDGGTLPALARHLQHNADRNRRVTGWLYGINIWGGLIGVTFTTFFALEHLGSRGALLGVAGLNLVIGFIAFGLGRREPASADADTTVSPGEAAPQAAAIPARWAYGAAFVTGFSFFVLEIVWYRLSTPLTGGSVYALGMVLLIVLLGLGMGGGCYALLARKIGHRPGVFALITVLQTCFVLVPYLLGDWFAWAVAMRIQEVVGKDFASVVWVWFLTVAALALLPCILAGMQFPMLLSLLGRGGERIGSQLGQAYAWNTAGAIAGSLLGGFVLLPWLGAEGLWLVAAGLGAVLALVFLLRHLQSTVDAAWWRPLSLASLLLLAALALGVVSVRGPGASWRDTAIGFGRADYFPESTSECPEFFAEQEKRIVDRREGRETAVAIAVSSSRAVLNNGKSDSSLHGDIPTTIGLALIPSVLHERGIRSGAIIGIGTGVTAGWLAAFPGVEEVDLMEIEPAMVEVLDWFADGNLNPLENPKVNVVLGDARETLATRQ